MSKCGASPLSNLISPLSSCSVFWIFSESHLIGCPFDIAVKQQLSMRRSKEPKTRSVYSYISISTLAFTQHIQERANNIPLTILSPPYTLTSNPSTSKTSPPISPTNSPTPSTVYTTPKFPHHPKYKSSSASPDRAAIERREAHQDHPA